MPAPTSYSESIYADYLVSTMGEVAGMLGWTAGSPAVQEALSDALLDLGLTDISLANTPFKIRGLRALGRRAIWRAVVQATSGKYTFGDAGQSFQRKQIHENALEALELAETECREWDPQYVVSIVGVTRTADPYIVIQDAQRIP